MSQKANYFTIGVFVLSSVALLVGAVIVLGGRALLHETITMETYINESVQGLEVGSPIKYRGVLIGNVDMIDFVRNVCNLPSGAPIDDERRRYVYVRAQIEPKKLGPRIARTQPELDSLIARGLRVRLASQGITGVAYLEIDYLDPATHPPLTVDWEPMSLYLPSAPSALARFTDAIDVIFRQLKSLDLEKLTRQAEELVTTATQTLDATSDKSLAADLRRLDGKLERLIDEPLSQLIDRASLLVQKLDSKVGVVDVQGVQGDVTALITELRGTNRELQAFLQGAAHSVAGITTLSQELTPLAVQAGHTMKRIDRMIAGREADLELVLANVRLITEHLKGLSDDAQRYPSQLLFGEPPTRTEPKKP